MNLPPAAPADLQKNRDLFLKQFRAYLRLVITAHQNRQAKQLKEMDGPNLMTYCMKLAPCCDRPNRTAPSPTVPRCYSPPGQTESR
jgi:hypothetical protein